MFLHLTQLDAHILHQYSEVNAMHLTASKNNLFYVVHQFFKAFFSLALLNAHAYIYSMSKYLYARTNLKAAN